MLMVQLLNLIRNVMVNLSVECDCCSVAEDSFAIDRVCINLIYNSKDEGRVHFGERVE